MPNRNQARAPVTKGESSKSVNLGRHKRCCKVCSHEKRDEIEQDFIASHNLTV